MIANGMHPEDFAIRYCKNAQTRILEEALIRLSIPYRIVGGTSFYERAEIIDMIAYLKVIAGSNDSIAAKRIINIPPRGIGN